MFESLSHAWGQERWIAGLAISLMALTVSIVLEGLGFYHGADVALNDWIASIGLDGPMEAMPGWGQWGWIGLLVFGLPQAVLHVRHRWQRISLVLGSAVLTLLWIPVLALAAIEVKLGAVCMAWIWVSVGSALHAEKSENLIEERDGQD